MSKCSLCKSTNITEHEYVESVTYLGEKIVVNLLCSICQECGHEFVPREQIEHNDAAIRNTVALIENPIGFLDSDE